MKHIFYILIFLSISINAHAGRLQVLSNNLLTDRTEGAEIVTNPDMSGTGGSFSGAGTGVGVIADNWDCIVEAGTTATGSKQAVTDAQIVTLVGSNRAYVNTGYVLGVSAGSYYKATTYSSSTTGTIKWRVKNASSSFFPVNIDVIAGTTQIEYFVATGTENLAMQYQLENGEGIVNFKSSLKEVTLDDFTLNSTLDASNYLEYGSGNTVRIVSDGGRNVGIVQNLNNGIYRYRVVVDAIDTDGVQLTANGDKVGMELGVNTGTINVTLGDISIRRKAGGCDVKISEFSMYRVVRPSESLEMGLTVSPYIFE